MGVGGWLGRRRRGGCGRGGGDARRVTDSVEGMDGPDGSMDLTGTVE